MEELEKRTSKFSAGLNIITRLDLLWKRTQGYIENGLHEKWNTILDIIWLELTRDLSPEDYGDSKDNEGKIVEGYKKLFDKFDEKLKQFLPFQDSARGFKVPDKEAIKKRGEQYKVLMDKQRFLARLENELGKGTSWGEVEDDWD